jgi:hypothetical protein
MKLPILPLLALALGVTGCAEDKMSLEIRAICEPNAECSFTSTCDAYYIGDIDVMAPSTAQPLWLFLEVANQLANNADETVGRVNSNDAHITEFTVTLSGANSGARTIPISNQVVPAGGSAVVALPIWFGTAPGATTATLQAVGYYDNGREFEGGEFPVNYWVVGSIPACTTGSDVCPGTGRQLPRACGT